MHFGSRSHAASTQNGSEGITQEEMLRLEEAKNRLFPPSLAAANDEAVDDGMLAHYSNSPVVSSPSAASNDFSFAMPKNYSAHVPGLSLPALAAFQVDVREVTLQRNVTGDFGFNVRRAQFPFFGSQQLRSVVFAEPCEVTAGPPRPSDLATGLLPGDQLIEVEGYAVDSLTREELLRLVQNAGRSIKLKVRSVPELAELCGKTRKGVRDEGDSLQFNNNIDNSMTQSSIPEEERYWLIHSNAYTLVRLMEHLPDGKARISVSGQEMIVDLSDIDRANPASTDRAADIASLKYLNETSTIHLLRQRYGSSLQYANGGAHSLLYMSGESMTDTSENLIKLFKGCRRNQMPPHIYATAQHVYRLLQMSGRSQSVVFTGVSASGKTMQMRNFVHYLNSAAGRVKSIDYAKITCALGVLEAFGNCATRLNQNSSRYVLLLSLGFDTSAHLCAATVQTFLLETSRLVRRPEKESVFHVFHYLWEGASPMLREQLELNKIDRPFIHPLKADDDIEAAKMAWKRLQESLNSLGFSSKQVDGIHNTLAAIFHLLFAEATQGPANKSSFIRAGNAQIAADLLGLTLDDLTYAVFKGSHASQMVSNTISRFSMSNRCQSGQEALNSFVQVLYQELFSTVTSIISKNLGQSSTNTSITLLDFPGGNFNSQWTEWKKDSPSTLDDLIFNYLNERIAELFYNCSFRDPAELYAREQVDVSVEKPLVAPHSLTRLIDRKQQLTNCADVDRRSEEPRGLLYILEEECSFPGATDESFIERIFIHHEQSRQLKRHAKNRLQFTLGHCLSTAPTTYSVDNWLRQAQPAHAAFIVPQLLQNAKREAISALFTISHLSHSDSSLKLRRATQSIQTESSGKYSIGGYFTNIAVQLEFLLNAVTRSSRIFFVHCIQSQPGSSQTATVSRTTDAMAFSASTDIDVPFVRQQLRSILLVDSIRSNNRGYPERLPFRDFRRRFQCLVHAQSQNALQDALDDRAAVQRILEKMEVYEHRYRLGISQVLLRNDVLMELEEQRDFCLSGLIVDLQTVCRKHLASRWLAKRRIQERAVRCIQKNAAAHLKVREWPWWKLYSRVIPLLDVARTDGEERESRLRISALEKANAELTAKNSRLEHELAEYMQLLKSECQTTQNLGLSLDGSNELRIQLEGEVQNLRQQLQASATGTTTNGDIERNVISKSSEPLHADADSSSNDKMLELKTEITRLRDHESTLKVKTQKAMEQLHDARAENEHLRCRNEQLEKRQKNFDGEGELLKEQMKEVTEQKEKAEKETREAVTNVQRKITEIQALKDENSELRSSLAKTRRELDEISEETTVGGATEENVNVLRKYKRDLESKVMELEDELDDVIGKNQLLEQSVTRLEMGMEKNRADCHREMEAKEAEIAEVRAQFQRRLRSAEDQVNELSDANSSLMRQNRVLEARARQIESQQTSNIDLTGGHYKRELRKTLALLRDTQTVLAHERESAPNHTLIRQLKEQLEDAEAAKLAALKGRHSLESELIELRSQLDATTAAKTMAEDKVMVLLKEKNSAMALVEEHDEQLQSLLKKYKAQIQQSSVDSITLADQIEQIADLESAKSRLQEQISEVRSSLEFLQMSTVEKHKYQLLELKIRDLEAKLDLESAYKLRLESINVKLKDDVDCLQEQLDEAKALKDREIESGRKRKKEVQLLQERINDLERHQTELLHKMSIRQSENDKITDEHNATVSDLKVALKRVDALQAALNADITAGSDIEEEDEDCDETHSSVSDTSTTRRSMQNGVHSVC